MKKYIYIKPITEVRESELRVALLAGSDKESFTYLENSLTNGSFWDDEEDDNSGFAQSNNNLWDE